MFGVLIGPDQLRDNSILCSTQAFGILFFSSCVIWLWFFISLSLFLRLYRSGMFDTDLGWVMVVATVFFAMGSSIAPVAADVLSFTHVWCFIDANETAWLFSTYYGIFGVLCFLGIGLWIAIMTKVYRILKTYKKEANTKGTFLNLRKKNQRIISATSGYELPDDANSISETEDYNDPDNNNFNDNGNNNNNHHHNNNNPVGGPKEFDLWDAMLLVIRQLIFVFLFAIMFCITIFNRISIVASGGQNSFTGWLLHCIVMSAFGFCSFLIFFPSASNLDWCKRIMGWVGDKIRYCCCMCCCRCWMCCKDYEQLT